MNYLEINAVPMNYLEINAVHMNYLAINAVQINYLRDKCSSDELPEDTCSSDEKKLNRQVADTLGQLYFQWFTMSFKKVKTYKCAKKFTYACNYTLLYFSFFSNVL